MNYPVKAVVSITVLIFASLVLTFASVFQYKKASKVLKDKSDKSIKLTALLLFLSGVSSTLSFIIILISIILFNVMKKEDVGLNFRKVF
jgi:uncharacterized protein with PQ loop repeat